MIGAAETVGKTLDQIKNITNGPDEVLALRNEISDLTVVLKNAESYATAAAGAVSSVEHLEHTSVLAERAPCRLAQLEKSMQRYLPELGGSKRRGSLLRTQWTLLKSKFNGLRVDLRDIKPSIIMQITTVTVYVNDIQYPLSLRPLTVL